MEEILVCPSLMFFSGLYRTLNVFVSPLRKYWSLQTTGEKTTFSVQATDFTFIQSDFLHNKVIGTLVRGFHTSEVLFGD